MKFDDQVWILEMSQAHFPNIIADADATEEFVKIDFSKIKKDEFAANIPPPGYIGDIQPDTVQELMNEHFCPIADHSLTRMVSCRHAAQASLPRRACRRLTRGMLDTCQHPDL